jgi:hypothetical protein
LGASQNAGEGIVYVVCDPERQFAEGGHFLSVNLLFPLSFMARVGLCDGFEALAQPFAGGLLLGISEQLVSLRPNFAPLVIGNLVTHLLDEYQQRPPCTFTVSTALRDPSCAFNYRFGFLPMT